MTAGCRRPGGRSFQTRGMGAEKLLSPGKSVVSVDEDDKRSDVLELDRSGRRQASDSRRQSSMRYAGATPSRDW